ncbi:hypothetical protein [Acinetobacter calcoaceticus]|uniref:hypothetical protein n=1 Tax=Acinetobacter calcoaceticus TaxID=471 RepID=UPI0002CE38AA|nr:hypothetical protein [Acinetobacter calcoaceticus]ENU07750.1 hypothetical protein F997_03613 [Acinetobacter calcoaceticus NIPH 13]
MSEVTTTTATDTAATTTTAAPADTATTTTDTATAPVTTETTTVETTPSDTATDTTEQTQDVLLGGEQPPAEQPVQYTDFQMPEGFTLNPEDQTVLQELGQEFKMPQEAVQKLVDLGVQMQQRQVQEQLKTVSSWVDAAKADKEYGGENLQKNLLTAQRAFSLPRGDKISNILHKSGLGNHPDVIGFMTEVGKLLEPDSMTHGRGTNTANVTPASVWYDKS